MKSLKKWMAAGMLAAGGLACLVTEALADTQTVAGVEWTYTISDGKATVGRGYWTPAISEYTSGSITIPSQLGDCPVTAIGNHAFYGCSGLTNVMIPSSVTSIVEQAFSCCSGLAGITIPSSVTSIGYQAFYGCSGLTSMTIPDSVTSIGDYAFYGCGGLTAITVGAGNPAYASKNGVLFTKDGKTLACYPGGKTGAYSIPSGVTAIRDGAFARCSGLTGVTIPASVTSIGRGEFYMCSGLTNMTIPASVTSIGDNAFDCCYCLTNVTVSASVTNIGNYMFYQCYGLTSVTIPDGVTSIGDHAFYYCSSLTSMTIPDSVTSIGDYAFCYCSGLTSVTIPDSVTSIGQYAFDGCRGLTSVTIPSRVTAIENGAFCYCSGLTSMTISDSVTNIGDYAFCGCSGLTGVTIPASVTSIGSDAFCYCSGLKTLDVPASWKGTSMLANAGLPEGCEVVYGGAPEVEVTWLYSISNGVATVTGAEPAGGYLVIPEELGGCPVVVIGDRAFEGCAGLRSVVLPDSVTNIGEYAFHGCSGLASMTIGNGISSIGSGAFSDCSGLTSVRIPDSVTNIGTYMFYQCYALTNVTIPASVTSIGYEAFASCSGLRSVTIPDSVTSIGELAFAWCNGLTNVTIGNSVTSIGVHAFNACIRLTSVTIPDSVTGIGGGAFKYCNNLTNVTILGNVMTDWSVSTSPFSNCTHIATVILGGKVTKIGNSMFYGCSGLTNVVIPDSVTSIGSGAFSGCNGLTGVAIPESVTSIGSSAFYGCGGLTNVTILGNVTNDGSSSCSFGRCTNLVTLILGGKVTNIGNSMFYGCTGLTELTIPEGVTNIGDNTFGYCSGLRSVAVLGDVKNSWWVSRTNSTPFLACSNLATVVLGGKMTAIGNSMFYGCGGLTNVIVGNDVTDIGEYAFYDCSGLSNVLIGNGVTNIGRYAFEGCIGLTSLTIPDSVTNIGEDTFRGCNGLANVVIGNGVTNIGRYAFEGCIGLTGLTIPDSVTSIGRYAFSGCRELANVIIGNGVTNIGATMFYGCNGLTGVTIGDSVESIDVTAFYGRNSLTAFSVSSGNPYYRSEAGLLLTKDGKTLRFGVNGSVVIPDSVTCIGDDAFGGFSGLANVTIPDSVTRIGSGAFYDCSGLTSVTIPNSVKDIGDSAFCGCSGLTSVTIPDSVTDIGDRAFYGCGGLASVTIGNNVTSIGDSVFRDCGSLRSVTIPESVTRIGDSVFYGCSGLTSVTIPDSVTSIGANAFRGCTELVSVTIPDGVTSIGNYAFADCSGLRSLFVPESWEGTTKLSKAGVPPECEVLYGGYAELDENGNYVFRSKGFEWTFRKQEDGKAILTAVRGAVAWLDVMPEIRIRGEGYVPVVRMADNALEGVDGLGVVVVPDSVEGMASGAFAGCPELRRILLPARWEGTAELSGVSLPEGCEVVYYHSGALSESQTWTAESVHVVNGTLLVAGGVSLTIEPGAVVKFLDGSSLRVDGGGVCVAKGVVFTHINDDTAGGDTMGDGNGSVPAANSYSLSGNVVTDAATEMRWLLVNVSGTISGDAVWSALRVLCVTGNVTVASGATLTVEPGAVVKFNPGMSLTVDSGGTLNAIGTRAQPITFTSVKDDERGGDTNGDGDATVAQPGDWARIYAGGTVNMDYCRIRYCNNNSDYGAIHGTGGTVRFDDGVIEYSVYECVRMNSGRFESRNSVFREASMGFGYYGGNGVYVYNGVVADCTIACRASNKHFHNTVFYRCQTFLESTSSSSDHCLFFNPADYGAQSASQVGSNGNIWGDPLFLDADGGDFRVSEGSPCVDAGDTAAAPETDYYGQPRVSVFGEALADIGIYEVQPRGVAGDVDLVPVSVSTDAEAAPGGELRVSWVVGNRGGKVANGARRDAVSLVSAGGREVSLGEKVFTQSVAAGGTAKCEAVFRVPPMAEGTWWPKVVVNSQQDIFEGSLIANNARTGETGVEVSLPVTAAATGASGTVAAGVPTVLKLHFEEGDGNRMVVLNVPQGVSVAWGFGFMPATGGASGISGVGGTTGTFGTTGTGETAEANGSPVQFVVPEDAEAVYVVLESGTDATYTLATESAKVAVTGVEPGEVPSSGNATLAISGAGFTAGSAVRLVGNGATIEVDSVRVVDTRTISATVDCGKLSAGTSYDVEIEAAGGIVTAEKAVRVEEAPGEGKFWARLVVPDSVREGRKAVCSIEYGNSGNADIAAPVLQVAMNGTGTLGYVDGLQGLKTLQFVAAGEDGSAGVLRPGCERRIRFELVAGKSNRMTLHTSVGSAYAPEPWERMEEYLADLSAAATRVGLRAQDATDYERVSKLAEAVKQGKASSVICGRVVSEDGMGIGGLSLVVCPTNSNQDITCLTDENGYFISPVLDIGDYKVGINHMCDDTLRDIRIPSNTSDVVLSIKMDCKATLHVLPPLGGFEETLELTLIRENDGKNTFIRTAQEDGVRFVGLEPGIYRISAKQSGQQYRAMLTLPEDVTTVEVSLEKAVTGSVDGLLSGPYAVQSDIVALIGRWGCLFSHVSDEGCFTFSDIPSGNWLCGVVGPDGAKYDVCMIDVQEGEVLQLAMVSNEEIPTSMRFLPVRETDDPYALWWFQVRDEAWKLYEKAVPLLNRPVPLPPEHVRCTENMAKYHEDLGYREGWSHALVSYLDAYRQTDGMLPLANASKVVGDGAKLVFSYCEKIFFGSSWGTKVLGRIDDFVESYGESNVVGDALWRSQVGDLRALMKAAAKLSNVKWSDVDTLDEAVAVLETALKLHAEASRLLKSASFVALLEGEMDPQTHRDLLDVLDVTGTVADHLQVIVDIYRAAQSTKGYFAGIAEMRDVMSTMQGLIPKYEAISAQFGDYHDPCPGAEPDDLVGPYVDQSTPSVPQSCDPNEMAGPLGAGAERYVAPGEEMMYTVYFENKSDATAAAQEVYVTEQLSGALDWSTFEVVDVGFNNQIDLGLGGKRKGASETAMTGTAYKVRTTLDFDGKTGVAKWYMRIVDEATETRWPKDVFAGFLPPNDETGRGEGHITYRVKVRDDAAAGTIIRASASIVFDYNAAIETDPSWWNTVAKMGSATVDLGNGVATNVTVMVGAPWIGQLPDPGKRPGMRFAGWFTGPNGTGSAVTEESVAAAGAKLYAFWDASAAPELWLDVSWGAVEIGTNGVVKGYAPDGSSVEGSANRYVLTGMSRVHGVKFTGGSFTNTWTNLVVDLDAKDAIAVSLEGASVEVTLEGDNFIASGEDCAGVRVDEESSLVLEGTGRLEAWGGAYGAGIGSGLDQKSGRVEVRGGTVEAHGGTFGAGIGGGLVSPGAEVVVTGGSVKARGSRGADIGAGYGEPQKREPTDGAGAVAHEVEVPLATDTLPAEVVVDLGGGKTYRYAGPGHEGDTSLWFWLPDGTYEFAADGDDYGAHVAGTNAAAVFTDPGNANFVAPPVGEVSCEGNAMRAAMDPAYRTSPFEVWTATGLKGNAWDWTPVPPGGYDWDATNAVIRIPDGTNKTRVLRLKFLAR